MNKRLIILYIFHLLSLQVINAQTIQSKTREVRVLDHKSIDSILDIREDHLIFFWGTWCHPCYESLDTIMKMDLKVKKMKTLILAESNSSMKTLEKVFRKYRLSIADNIVFGLLDPKDYKKSHRKNIQIFNRFICKACVEESKNDMRFSAVFIFDKNKKLLYYNKVLLPDEYNLIREVINSL